jgi:hypothetical protein
MFLYYYDSVSLHFFTILRNPWLYFSNSRQHHGWLDWLATKETEAIVSRFISYCISEKIEKDIDHI